MSAATVARNLATGAAETALTGPGLALYGAGVLPGALRLARAHPGAALAVATTPPWGWRAVGLVWFASMTGGMVDPTPGEAAPERAAA